jgi:putative FmdB family regulatory protein
MPTYQYECDNCGYEFEQFQLITAKPLRKCPKCGKNSLNRLIGTGAGVIFKGSGFYATDYRSKSYKEAEKKEKDSGGKKTEEKKSEAKEPKPSKKDKSPPSEKKQSVK